MPETTVNRDKLLSQIKEAHGKVVYTYTAHHKIIDRAKKRKAFLDKAEIAITSVSAVGLLSGLITNETALKLVGGLSSAISLAITLYKKMTHYRLLSTNTRMQLMTCGLCEKNISP